MAIMTLWSKVKIFTDSLPKNDLNPQENLQVIDFVYQNYLSTKQFSKLINSVYGFIVTMFLMDCILFYAINFDDIFVVNTNQNHVIKVIKVIFYFTSTCAVLFVAADVPKKV